MESDLLANLGIINPDLAVQNPQYRFEPRFQQEIIGMLLNDHVFLTQSAGLVKPNYFTLGAHEAICSCLFDYFEEHRHVPALFVLRELVRQRTQGDEIRCVRAFSELELCMQSFVPGNIDREFCLDQIANFAKEQALKIAIQNACKFMNKRDDPARWTKVEDEFKKALLVERSMDIGLDYFNTFDDRFARVRKQQEEMEVFITDFEGIDNRLDGGGLRRGEIGSFMGLPGTGKSVMLVQSSVANLRRNKKVLYLSLEMSQDKLAKRFDSVLGRLRMTELSHKFDAAAGDVEELHAKANRRIKETILGDFSHYVDKRTLMIKQFAAGTADVNTIRAYIAQATLRGFRPDLIALDYVGEMKDIEGLKTYESRQRTVRDLRAMGLQENVCIFTAMQPNRSARQQEKEGVIDDDSLADSFGQARPLDALWSINMTAQEKTAGVGRLFIVKHRDGDSRVTVYIKKSDECLGFEQISEDKYRAMMAKAQDQMSNLTNPVDSFKSNKKQDKPNEE